MKTPLDLTASPLPSTGAGGDKTSRLTDLLQEAQALPDRRRPSWSKYAPVVRVLRSKGMTFREVYGWLLERGEPLPPDDASFNRFRAAISMKESSSERANAKAAARLK